MKPTISLIAAIGENRVIGDHGKIPWHIKEDLQRFKCLTQNHAVIMGRKTYESIGKALPNRLNIIITRDVAYTAQMSDRNDLSDSSKNVTKVVILHSLQEGIDYVISSKNAGGDVEEFGGDSSPSKTQEIASISPKEIFIIGGGQMFQEAISIADKLYLTIVKGNFNGDAFFPPYSDLFTKMTYSEKGKSGEYEYEFVNLERL